MTFGKTVKGLFVYIGTFILSNWIVDIITTFFGIKIYQYYDSGPPDGLISLPFPIYSSYKINNIEKGYSILGIILNILLLSFVIYLFNRKRINSFILFNLLLIFNIILLLFPDKSFDLFFFNS
jgi:hypothetical protein